MSNLVTKPPPEASTERWVEVGKLDKRRYWVSFHQHKGDGVYEGIPLGTYHTLDGSLIKLAKIIAGYIRDGLIPVDLKKD